MPYACGKLSRPLLALFLMLRTFKDYLKNDRTFRLLWTLKSSGTRNIQPHLPHLFNRTRWKDEIAFSQLTQCVLVWLALWATLKMLRSLSNTKKLKIVTIQSSHELAANIGKSCIASDDSLAGLLRSVMPGYEPRTSCFTDWCHLAHRACHGVTITNFCNQNIFSIETTFDQGA